MYDTHVTIVGNVLTLPELRRTKNTGAVVAHFKVASTARRLDRETGQWVDGHSFRVRVNCWRRLAESVHACLVTGDPVVVVGRLYTRDWTDENDNHRIGYELDAIAVGHDLSRGQGSFKRYRPALSTSTVEDEQGPVHVGGEQTEPVPADRAAARDGMEAPGTAASVPAAEPGDELLGAHDDLGAAEDLAAGLGLGAAEAGNDQPGDEDLVGGELGVGEPVGGQGATEDRRGRGRRRGRTAVPV